MQQLAERLDHFRALYDFNDLLTDSCGGQTEFRLFIIFAQAEHQFIASSNTL